MGALSKCIVNFFYILILKIKNATGPILSVCAKTSMGARDKGLAYNAGGLNIKKENECEVNVMHGRW